VKDGLFAIFNPTTGVYTKVNGLDNAKTTLASIKQAIINGFSVQMYQKIIDNSTQESAWSIYNQ
jgi:hypothetical protein